MSASPQAAAHLSLDLGLGGEARKPQSGRGAHHPGGGRGGAGGRGGLGAAPPPGTHGIGLSSNRRGPSKQSVVSDRQPRHGRQPASQPSARPRQGVLLPGTYGPGAAVEVDRQGLPEEAQRLRRGLQDMVRGAQVMRELTYPSTTPSSTSQTVERCQLLVRRTAYLDLGRLRWLARCVWPIRWRVSCLPAPRSHRHRRCC